MIINVKVKAGSKKDEIKQTGSNTYEASIKAKAERGKANIGLIKLLAEHFNALSREIRIKSGWTAKRKVIEIVDKNDTV